MATQNTPEVEACFAELADTYPTIAADCLTKADTFRPGFSKHVLYSDCLKHEGYLDAVEACTALHTGPGAIALPEALTILDPKDSGLSAQIDQTQTEPWPTEPWPVVSIGVIAFCIAVLMFFFYLHRKHEK